MSEQNPFFSVSLLPYQAPPFDLIQDCHYRPAFDEGIRQQRAEIRAIIDNPEPANFANTLEALEQSGQLLARVTRVFFAMAGAHTNRSSSLWMKNFLLSSPSWGMTSGLTRPYFSE